MSGESRPGVITEAAPESTARTEIDSIAGYADAFPVYHRLGWPSVLPVPYGAKQPPPKGYTGRGALLPSYPDMQTWAEQYPGANVAMPTPAGVVGIDVDNYGGKTGGQTLAEAEKRWGKLPPTYRSTSRDDNVSGIRLYRVPLGTQLRDGITFPEFHIGGIDVIQPHHRYAMVWPSRHPSGALYVWIDELDGSVMEHPPAVADLPPLPELWLENLRIDERPCNGADLAPEDAYNVDDALTAGTPAGKVAECLGVALGALTEPSGRHDATRGHVLALLRHGKGGAPGVLTAVTALQRSFIAATTGDRSRTPEEAAAEFRRFVRGDGAARMLAEPNWDPGGGEEISAPGDPVAPPSTGKGKAKPAPLRLITWQTAAEVSDKVPQWVFTHGGRGRIQRGTLALFAGRPAAGKSTAARSFAAQLTRGTLEGCFFGEPQNVAYIASEESVEYVIKSSLRAVDADMPRIHFPTVQHDGQQVRLLSTVDAAALTVDLLARNVTAVFVDPVMSAIGSTVVIHRNNEVRAYIEPWARIADAIGGVVFGIVHLHKAPGGDIVAAINGSSAFGEVARSVIAFAKDPLSPEGHRVLSQEKNSAGSEDLALAYAIETTEVQTDEGPAEVGRFVILGPSDRRVGDVLRGEATKENLGAVAGKVLAAAYQAPGSVTPKFISEAVPELSNDDAGQYLRRLAAHGLLTKAGRGIYVRPNV